MAKTILNTLYHVMVQDTTCAASVQRRICAVGSSQGDGDLLAALASHPVIPDDVDSKIGKRVGAKERSAWVSRKERTLKELRAVLSKEKRVGVLVAAAKRTDLHHQDYMSLAQHKHPKVLSAIINNGSVTDAVKEHVAAVIGSTSIDDYDSRQDYNLVSLFRSRPQLHDALASRSELAHVLCFVAGSKTSEGVQRRILSFVAAPYISFMSTEGEAGYSDAHRYGTYKKALDEFAKNPHAFDEVRAELLLALKSASFKRTGRYGNHNSDTDRLELIKQLEMPAVVTSDDPMNEARSSSDPVRLLELAQAARDGRGEALAQALFSNTALTLDAGRLAAEALQYGSIKQVATDLSLRGRADLYAAVVVRYSYQTLNDETLVRFDNPTEVLALVAREMLEAFRAKGGARSAMEQQSMARSLLLSRYCTSGVLLEMPIVVFTTPDIPAHIPGILTAALAEAFQEDSRQWELFEALVGDGALPLREAIAAVKALS